MSVSPRSASEPVARYVGVEVTPRGAVLISLVFSHFIALYVLPGGEIPSAISTLTGVVVFLFVSGYVVASMISADPAETAISAVGISVIFLVLVGFVLNFGLPVKAPLEHVPIVVLVVTTALIVRFELSDYSYTRLASNPSPKRLLVWLALPVIATVGGFLVSTRNANFLSIATVPLVGVAGLLLVYDSPSDRSTNCLGSYCVFLSLMLLNSASIRLISGYGDAHKEFHAAQEVITTGAWHPGESAISALASVKLFVPVVAIGGDVPLPVIFKFIVPLIYALAGPLAYLLYRNMFDERTAALATLVTAFGSGFLFNPVIAGLSRQSLSLVFALFFAYLLFNRQSYRSTVGQALLVGSVLLSVMFHYSISFLYSLPIAAGVVSVPVVKTVTTRLPFVDPPDLLNRRHYRLTFVLALLFLVVTMSYYYFINDHVYSALSVRISQLLIALLGPIQSSTNQAIASGARSLPYAVLKYLYMLEVAFMGLGLLFVLYGSETDVSLDYLTVAGMFYGMLGVIAVGPYLFFGIDRVFTLTVPILALFLIVGFIRCTRKLPAFDISRARAVLAVVLVFALLLNSGWIMEITNSYPNSPGLSQASMSDETHSERVKFYNHFQDFEQDKRLAVFFRGRTDYQTDGVYIDGLSSYLLRSYGGGDSSSRNWFVEGSQQFPAEKINAGSYAMLGYANTQMDTYANIGFGPIEQYSYSDIRPLVSNTSRIYDNGASVAYKNTR